MRDSSRWPTTRRQVLGLAMLGVLAGCGRSEPALPARLERIKPTQLPTPGLTARHDQPLESRIVDGPRFRLAIPAAWADRRLAAPQEGSSMFSYDADSRPPERPVRIGVVVEDPTVADAIEQAQVIVVAKTAAGAKEIRSSMVTWPGGLYAVLVDWVETRGGGHEVPYRTRQLMVQVSGRAIVNVLGIAPADEYESLKLDDIISTLQIQSG